MDYAFEKKAVEIRAAVFYTHADFTENKRRVYGTEWYGHIEKGGLSASCSFTWLNGLVKNDSVSYPSAYDLKYFFRADLAYDFGGLFSVKAVWLHRQGVHEVPVLGAALDQNLDIYAPRYASLTVSERLPDYSRVDLSISKLMPLKYINGVVLFASVNNLLNRNNVQMSTYNYDYSQKMYDSFSLRTFYFGGVFTF